MWFWPFEDCYLKMLIRSLASEAGSLYEVTLEGLYQLGKAAAECWLHIIATIVNTLPSQAATWGCFVRVISIYREIIWSHFGSRDRVVCDTSWGKLLIVGRLPCYHCDFDSLSSCYLKMLIWVKFLRAYKAWKWCHIFSLFDHCFRQSRGLEGQEMNYILKIYQCGSIEMPLHQPYQPFI